MHYHVVKVNPQKYAGYPGRGYTSGRARTIMYISRGWEPFLDVNGITLRQASKRIYKKKGYVCVAVYRVMYVSVPYHIRFYVLDITRLITSP